MNNTIEHQKLVHDIIAKFGSLPHLRLWKNNTGVARTLDGNRLIKFGLKSSADISGIISPSGKRVEIEVKTGKAVQTPGQKRFDVMINKFGGIYVIARDLNDLYFLLMPI